MPRLSKIEHRRLGTSIEAAVLNAFQEHPDYLFPKLRKGDPLTPGQRNRIAVIARSVRKRAVGLLKGSAEGGGPAPPVAGQGDRPPGLRE